MIKKSDEQDSDLRRGVDHVGVCVCFVVHDGKGNILLQKRSQKTRDERGTWDIGGGAVEFGESIDEAVRRELLEELGVVPLDVKFLNVGDAHRRNHEGAKTHWVYLLHVVLVDKKNVIIGEPEKIDEIGWFKPERLPSPLHSVVESDILNAKNIAIIKQVLQ